MNTAHGRYLAAATALSLAAFAPQAMAGLDVGGIVGGVVGGTLGSSHDGYSGTSGGISATAGVSIGRTGAAVKANAYIGSIKTKTKVVLLKKKLVTAKVLVGKHGSYGKHGKLTKVTAVIGTKPVYAKAKVLVGKHGSYGNLAKVKAVIGTNPLDAKAKVLVGNVAKAKVFASLGGKTKVKGQLAVAGISANVNLGLNLGGVGGNNPDGNNGTPPGSSPGGGSSPGAMASKFRDLSTHDQLLLNRKCSAVLAVPARFNSDLVELCRIIATL